MAQKSFAVELDQLIQEQAISRLTSTPVELTKLAVSAGYIQGLKAAKQLFEQVIKDNNKEREQS